ncbi:hypothetical protein BDV18DRAFT_139346 [Aspergillus unguis]
MPGPITIVDPVLPVRQLEADEEYVMTAFERHADHCPRCSDPLRTFEESQSLCTRGTQHAIDVTNYLYSKRGKSYSAVDRERNQPTLVKIPRDCIATRSLLLAVEDGLTLRKEKLSRSQSQRSSASSSPKPVQKPVISYDRTYHVAPRINRSQTVTEIIEREPRTPNVNIKSRRIIVYPSPHRSRGSSARGSPSRGSLYDSDAADRIERVKESSRIYRPEYYR